MVFCVRPEVIKPAFLVLLRDLVIAEIGPASSPLCTSGVN